MEWERMERINIFDYSNYREYMADFYKFKKSVDACYTYKTFADEGEIKSPNYLHLVICKKRNLSIKNISKFIKALNLNKEEATYFESLVKLDQSLSFSEKADLFEKIYKQNLLYRVKELKTEQYKVISSWYYLAIQEMVLLKDFNPSPEWISKKLKGKILVEEAQEAFDCLKRLDIVREKDGKYILTNIVQTTTDDVANAAIKLFHKSMIEKSLESLLDDPVSQRDFSGLTVAISKKKFDLAKAKIKEFRRELNKFLSDDAEQEDVYQLNIQFFELTGGPV